MAQLTEQYGYTGPSGGDALDADVLSRYLDTIPTVLRAGSEVEAAQKVAKVGMPALVLRRDTHTLWVYTTSYPDGLLIAGPERIEVVGSALVGQWNGQPITRQYLGGVANPDGNGDHIVFANPAFAGGGVLRATASGADRFDIRVSCRPLSGNVVMRAYTMGGDIVFDDYLFSATIEYWKG